MSKLSDKIDEGIKAAMRAKDRERLTALRDIKAKLILEATSGEGEVDEVKENQVILKLHKQRTESYELYKEQGREDLAETELFEAKIIEEFMPEMMTEDEILELVKKTIQEVGATGPQDMGKVMGPLTKQLAGKADGKVIAKLVNGELRK